MPQKLVRSFCLKPDLRIFRDTSDPKIVGYAAVFNSSTDLGYCTESIDPGAFRDSLARGDDVAALVNHDPNLVLGRTPKTLSLATDSHGLRCEILPPDTTIGLDIQKLLDRGDVSQMSFGFYIEDQNIDRSKDSPLPHVTIMQARLFDVSVVTFPQYDDTEAEMKRMREERKQDVLERLREFLPEDVVARAVKEHRDRFISQMRSEYSL